MYTKASNLTQLPAETELNWAFANYDGTPVPALVITRCDAALDKRPGWQAAHYLRGLGHYEEAKQMLQSDLDESGRNTLAKSISDARFDFERAILIGPPSARLFTDAAAAYMIPSANPPTERLKELVKSAVVQGMLRSQLNTFGKRHNWLGEPWFQELDSLCARNPTVFYEPNYAEMFLTPPNADLVEARLKAYRSELNEVPFRARLAAER